jgi:2-polyprenyl-3-methyl-5-hydroxy-6-metoxy-1,4-benzoquinol methylase
MQIATCDLCGQDDTTQVEQTISHGFLITNVICRNCTLVYTNPRIEEADPKEFYKTGEYRKLSTGWAEPTRMRIIGTRRRARHIIEFCSPYIKHESSVIEIGCGTGEVLAQIRDRFGCKVTGIEPDPSYQEYAERVHGIMVMNSMLEEVSPPPDKADLVILSHVLEHFASPRAALQTIRSLLAADGMVYVEVPNLFFHKSFSVAHPYTFHSGTLRAMLASEGFKVVWMHAHGRPGLPWVPSNLSTLARRDEETRVQYAIADYRSVLTRRKLGRLLGRVPEVASHGQGMIARMIRRLVGPGRYSRIRDLYWKRMGRLH